MMVGRPVQLEVQKERGQAGGHRAEVEDLHVRSQRTQEGRGARRELQVRAGEIVCIAGIDGNGQTELVYGITGLEKPESGKISALRAGHCPRRHNGPRREHEPHPRGPAQARPGPGLHAGAEHGAPALSGKAVPARGLHRPRQRAQLCRAAHRASSTSAPARGRSPSRAACPAATSRRPSSRASWTGISRSSWRCSPRAAWTWAPLSISTASWWRQRDAGKAILLVSPGAGRGYEPFRPHPGHVRGRDRGRARPEEDHGRRSSASTWPAQSAKRKGGEGMSERLDSFSGRRTARARCWPAWPPSSSAFWSGCVVILVVGYTATTSLAKSAWEGVR